MTKGQENAQLQGRHAAVTGAARGIGAAVAERLHALGCNLTLLDLAEDALQAKSTELAGAQPIVVNVTDEERVQQAFTQAESALGPVEILVNCAGIAESAPLAKTDMAMWDRTLAVNLTGTFLTTRAVLAGHGCEGLGQNNFNREYRRSHRLCLYAGILCLQTRCYWIDPGAGLGSRAHRPYRERGLSDIHGNGITGAHTAEYYRENRLYAG